MTTEQEIVSVLRAYDEAIYDKNAEAATALLSEDVTHYSLAPPLAVEGAAARDPAGLQAWFVTWEGPITIETPSWAIHASGDCAFASGLCRMTGQKHNERAVDLWYRRTTCLRKVGGEWRIAVMHESVPFAMDGSDKALLDLKPN